MRNILILSVALAIGTGAVARDTPRLDPEAKFAREVAGLVPGAPLTCLPNRPEASTKAIGSRLLYRVSRNLVYVNETTGGCEAAARGDALVTRSPIGRVCSGDISQTVDLRGAGMTTGSCALGDFVPYRRP